jgi:Na+-driven multidrug efflux pump
MAFSTTPHFLALVEKTFRASFAVMFLQPMQPLLQGLLQSQRKNLRASVLAVFTQILPIPIFTAILYITDKHNTARIFWANSLHVAFSFIILTAFVVGLIREIWAAAKEKPGIEPEDAVPELAGEIQDELVKTENL